MTFVYNLNDIFLKTEITEVDDLVERSYRFFIKNNIRVKVEYLKTDGIAGTISDSSLEL